MSEPGAFRRLMDRYVSGALTRLEVRGQLMDSLAGEPLETLEKQIGRAEFLALKGDVARYPWTDDEWTKFNVVIIAGVTERERPKMDPESLERYRRKSEAEVAKGKIQLRRAVERFRAHFGVAAPATTKATLVVAMWRPDEDRSYFLDGRWAADQNVYHVDEIPAKSYGGQERWPMPFFPQVSDAEEYLGASRPHTACQVGLDDFRRRWPTFNLIVPT